MKVETRIILSSIAFGLTVWVIDAWLDYVIFYDDTFLNLLVLKIPPHEIYIRLVILGSFTFFGVLVSIAFARREQTEQALHEREKWHATTLRSIGDAVISTDSRGMVSFMNPIAEALTGWQLEDAQGKPLTEVFKIVSEITGEPQTNPVDKVLREGVVVGLANHTGLIARDGTRRSITDSGAPIKDDAGTMLGTVLVFRDVTEDQQAEDAFRASEEKFRAVVQNSQAVIFMTDQDGVFTLSEGAQLATLGLQAGQVVGLSAFEVYKDYPTIVNALRQALAGKPIREADLWVDGPDGNQIHFDTSFAPYKDSEGAVIGVIGVAMDTTQRKQAEDKLQQYTNRLSNLRAIDKAILSKNSPDELAQATLDSLRKLIPCDRASVTLYDYENAEVHMLAVSRSGATELQKGGVIPLAKYLIPEQLQQGESYIVENIEALAEPSSTNRMLLKEGIHTYATVPMFTQGQLLGSLNVGHAEQGIITADHLEIMREVADQLAIAIWQARLHDQVQRYASDLEQHVAERTAELETANQTLQELSDIKDEFISNVSHELRSPITSMMLHLHMLNVRPEHKNRYLATLNRETHRLENIVDALLYVSRLDQERIEFDLQAHDLGQLLETYITDRKMIAESRNIQLTLQPREDPLYVSADHAQIGQVISILLTNAINYTPDGGRVTVDIQVVAEPHQLWAVFSVADTGPGISADEQDKLFLRFYRGSAGKNSGAPGTGLGLSIAQEIVERHGGRIEVESEGIPGQGATFSVWLPTG